ncbi:hypothetical protein [Micromonospora carbonacea]|uniref:Uncharacterized protein n=1 Tax=Micromonospora carbonacea TaxID=47853 RepID=A0A7H8XSJ7_9ACTN|nr:hypothetical protein [Micromonospora carbonacea]MBB5830095.1 hypothetical protein [Micromonospora carbonacea]QLD27983.1 hypothetical protein HXZ27_30360 [Micromonospora carbonacea]
MDLTLAFAALLGRSDSPAGSYDAYYGGDTLDEFLLPASWLTPAALASSAPVALPDVDACFLDDDHADLAWEFDLAGSLFAIEWAEDVLPAAFLADARAADPDLLVGGADLGVLLARHGVDLTAESAGRLSYRISPLLRLATDGTLHDAMRMATFTHRLPALVPFGDEGWRRVEPGWAEALAAVEPPELRDHLSLHCLEPFSSRAAGARYLGANEWPTGTSALDGRRKLLAGWEFGESQSGVAVVA